MWKKFTHLLRRFQTFPLLAGGVAKCDVIIYKLDRFQHDNEQNVAILIHFYLPMFYYQGFLMWNVIHAHIIEVQTVE